MSRPYFRQVPNFDYVSRNPGNKYISEYITVKNLFKRGKLREDIFGDLSFFEKYSIVGDERPDNVAAKFYNDPTLDWVILLSNNILNITSEWPMTRSTFDKVMLEKYGSYENLYNVHHYETLELKNSLGSTVLKGGIKMNNKWETNGNFVKIESNKIDNIYAFNYTTQQTTNKVTVVLKEGIENLTVGDTIFIQGISEAVYNGKFKVSEVNYTIGDFSYIFTYELSTTPTNSFPLLSNNEKFYIIPNELSDSMTNFNAYYYEYWDEGLGYSVLVSSVKFIREVTNYEYEFNLEEEKRNIYVLKPIYLNIVFNDMDDIMPYKEGSQQYVTETLKKGDNIRLYE